MSADIFSVSGNNVPEITTSTTSKETLEIVRLLINRKRNSFPGYSLDDGAGADGFNRAVTELEEEVDLALRKIG